MIIDSGCSHHMFNSYAGSGAASGGGVAGGDASGGGTNYKKVHGKSVRVANGTELSIAGKFDFGIMTGCLHVPDLTRNLLSVRQLTRDGYSLTFSEDKVLLNHPTIPIPVQIGTLSNNLYIATADLYRIVQPPTAEANMVETMDTFISHRWDPKLQFANGAKTSNAFAFAPTDLTNIQYRDISNDLTIDLLHRRFGHVDPNKIIQLLRREAVDGLQLSHDKLRPHHHCEHCIIAKAT